MFRALSPGRRTLVFALLLFCHVYFLQVYPRFLFTNEYSRFLLVSAVADFGTLKADEPLRVFGDSQDKALYDGHYYSDKAIGTSILGLPVYLLIKLVRPMASWLLNPAIIVFVLRLACITLPSLLFLPLPGRLWEKMGASSSQTLPFLFLLQFGTIVFPYSMQFISHHLLGMLLFLSFYCIWKDRDEPSWLLLLASGAASGFALITEYPAVFPVACVFGYLLSSVRDRSRIWLYLAGGAPWVLLLLGYNEAIFGTPFDVTYRHMSDPGHVLQHGQGFVGFGFPRWNALWGQLFSASRGLFYYSPVLLFGIPGVYKMIRDPEWRREGLLFASISLSYILFHSGMSNWQGGWCLGPRYLTPTVPCLMTAVCFYWIRSKSWLMSGALIFTGLLSILFITIGTITFPFPAEEIRTPVFSLFGPLFFHSGFGLNLGNWLGLHGSGPGILFYALLTITFIVMVAPAGEIRFEAGAFRKKALPGILALALVLAGGILTPPPDAVVCYARGSMYFYLGRYKDSLLDLNEALNLHPDAHIEALVKRRLAQVSMLQEPNGT